MRQHFAVAMKCFELPDRGGERLVVATHRGVSLVTRGDFAGQLAVRVADGGQPGLELRLRGAQRLFSPLQGRDVTRNGDLAYEFAADVQLRRGFQRDADDLAVAFAAIRER